MTVSVQRKGGEEEEEKELRDGERSENVYVNATVELKQSHQS